MEKFKIIALAGVGRAGKDTFYKFASEFLAENGISSGRWAFADELKKDLDEFVKDKFGYSVFTDDPVLKNEIRDLMVSYGKIWRKKSLGGHWISKIKSSLLAEDGPQIRFITDLRFGKFGEYDEIHFVKSNGGSIVHIERFEEPDWLGNCQIVPPVNEEERQNDPLLKENADVKVQWHDFKTNILGEEVGRKIVENVFKNNLNLWTLN
jgi:hypothetical protein